MAGNIDKSEGAVMSDLEDMESKRLEQATKVALEFEDRYNNAFCIMKKTTTFVYLYNTPALCPSLETNLKTISCDWSNWRLNKISPNQMLENGDWFPISIFYFYPCVTTFGLMHASY
jgi:hypothetical protein